MTTRACFSIPVLFLYHGYKKKAFVHNQPRTNDIMGNIKLDVIFRNSLATPLITTWGGLWLIMLKCGWSEVPSLFGQSRLNRRSKHDTIRNENSLTVDWHRHVVIKLKTLLLR